MNCSRCGNNIIGTYTTYNNRIFHPNCFVCFSCENPLGNGQFYLVNGQPTCRSCNANNSGPKCHKCKQAFKPGVSYKVQNGVCYHNECFICAGPCKSQLQGAFYILKSKYVCGNCYNKYGNDFDKFEQKKEEEKVKKEEVKKEKPKIEEPIKKYKPIYY